MFRERLKSALFVDFDNVYGGLHSLDPSEAEEMASEPWLWLGNLLEQTSGNISRDILVRRVYLNPAGRVSKPDGTWRYFSGVRPQLTKSGFEVIDCPSLTAAGKNAADIRIVMDILNYMTSNTRYDEFIIASSDADFTPLLYRLRAEDRRTVVVAAGQTSVAYREVADSVIDIGRLLEDGKLSSSEVIDIGRLLEGGKLSSSEDMGPHPSTRSHLDTPADTKDEQVDLVDNIDGDREKKLVVESALSHIRSCDEPILLASFASELRNLHESRVDLTNWFGTGSFGKFLLSIAPDLTIEGHYIRDPARHRARSDDASTLPELIRRICALTDLPRLTSEEWSALFIALAHYAAENEFNLTQCTAWCRDHVQQSGLTIGRGQVGYVVRASLYGGQPLNSMPPPTAEQVRMAVLQSTIARCRSLGLNLTNAEENELSEWLQNRDS